MIKIEQIIELEKANPKRLREYCYYDGCPTRWERGDIEATDIEKGKIAYVCEGCDSKIWYQLRFNEKGGKPNGNVI